MIHTLKKKLAKVLCGVLVFAQMGTIQAFARPDWPSDTGIEAEAGAVMDVDTGTMLFGQNSHVEYYPASITKILTALVVLEHADLTDTVGATTNNPDGVSVRNEHRLVITEDTESPYYCPEAVAGKTGYLLKAGNTLVTYGEKDGRRVVSVILKGSPRQYFVDGKNLLQFGLNRFQNVDIAENETRYVTGDDQVDVNGTSYAPSDLAVQAGKKITLPKDASFADAELSLGAVPDGAPEGTVGVLNYIYNERKIGSAYLMTKAGAEALAAAEAAGGTETTAAEEPSEESADAADPSSNDGNTDDQTETETMGETDVTTAADSEDASDQAGSGDVRAAFPVKIVLIIVGILAAAALIGGGIWFRIQSNKKEAEAEALRREKRRQRLMAEGGDAEAEFNRLLEEKRKRDEKRRKR